MNNELNQPPNFERLGLFCIEAKFWEQTLVEICDLLIKFARILSDILEKNAATTRNFFLSI